MATEADTNSLVADLRELLEHARGGGAPDELLKRGAEQLVDALLELEQRRRSNRSVLADKVAKARAYGLPIAELQERFGKSRATVYRLLSQARETHSRETRIVSDARHGGRAK